MRVLSSDMYSLGNLRGLQEDRGEGSGGGRDAASARVQGQRRERRPQRGGGRDAVVFCQGGTDLIMGN